MSETDSEVSGWYRDYLDLFSKLDNEVIEDVKRRYSEMARTWRDLFKPEIDEWLADNTRNNLFTYVQNGDMSLPNAARNAGMSIPEFEENMRDAGYTVPQRHDTLV